MAVSYDGSANARVAVEKGEGELEPMALPFTERLSVTFTHLMS